MSPFSEINVFELSRYTMILMTNIEVLLSGAPHMSHTQSQERRWSEGPGPEHALPPRALNTPLLNKQNLSRWVNVGSWDPSRHDIFLFNFQGVYSMDTVTVFTQHPDHLRQQTSNMFYDSLLLLEDIVLELISFRTWLSILYWHLWASFTSPIGKKCKEFIFITHIFRPLYHSSIV